MPSDPETLTNSTLVAALGEVSEHLESHGAKESRIEIYRAAARILRGLNREFIAILGEVGPPNRDCLDAIPGIPEEAWVVLLEALAAGHFALLDRLRGDESPEDLYAAVPGVGPTLAARVHHRLGIDSLEELEAAAIDGRLRRVPGFGARRLEQIREALTELLRHRRLGAADRPPVASLLAVDADYRRLAAADRLHRVAPRRLNPQRTAWLPVLHTDRGGWDFDVMFANSARAHALRKIDDWVVIHWSRGLSLGQVTAYTELAGPRAGARVIRGREDECPTPPRSASRKTPTLTIQTTAGPVTKVID